MCPRRTFHFRPDFLRDWEFVLVTCVLDGHFISVMIFRERMMRERVTKLIRIIQKANEEGPVGDVENYIWEFRY